MKIQVTLTPDELAETGLNPNELHAQIVKALDDSTPTLPGFNVAINVQGSAPDQTAIAQSTQPLEGLADLATLSLEFQGMSIVFDPRVAGVGQLLVSGESTPHSISKDEFWKDISRYSLMAAVLALKEKTRASVLQINDVVLVLSDFRRMQKLIDSILESEAPEQARVAVWLKSYLQFWFDENNETWTSSRYQLLHQGLAGKLTSLSHSAS